MRIETQTPFPTIEDRVLCWNANEAKAIVRVADLLAEARNAVGPDTDLGDELGKAEMILREYEDGAVIDSRALDVALLFA